LNAVGALRGVTLGQRDIGGDRAARRWKRRIGWGVHEGLHLARSAGGQRRGASACDSWRGRRSVDQRPASVPESDQQRVDVFVGQLRSRLRAHDRRAEKRERFIFACPRDEVQTNTRVNDAGGSAGIAHGCGAICSRRFAAATRRGPFRRVVSAYGSLRRLAEALGLTTSELIGLAEAVEDARAASNGARQDD
jgi:hypothetical protein